jgi:carbon monoxide dehydrogenase subunit G
MADTRKDFSFVRGTLKVMLRVLQAVAPVAARYTIANKGIGSSADVEAIVVLAPEGTGTRVRWMAEVKTLGGLLKLVPPGLIRGAERRQRYLERGGSEVERHGGEGRKICVRNTSL